jgi:glyoxylate utilization-related uncharacterized protein
MSTGSYAIPRRYALDLQERHPCGLSFPLIRKAYEWVDGIDAPPFWSPMTPTLNDYMPGTDGAWGTSRFVDPADMRHDMAVTIVTFQPGGVIRFLKPTSWNTGSMCLKVRRSITSTTTGLKLKQAISCGYAFAGVPHRWSGHSATFVQET